MSQEDEQIQQRRQHLEGVAALGAATYPNRFDRTDTISALVAAHGDATAESLEAGKIETVTAGRVLAIRSFGKASFLALSDGLQRIQVYIRQDALPERDFQIFKLLDLGDHVGVAGHLFRTRTGELTIHAKQARVPREVSSAAAREMARADRRRDPLPPALSRSDREPGRAHASSRCGRRWYRRFAGSSTRAGSSRSKRR